MRILLRIIADIELVNWDTFPRSGGLIVVTNHVGLLDAMLGVTFTPRNDFIIVIAQKYKANRFWRWIGNRVDAVWINRKQTDFRALRLAQRRLQEGEIAGIAPEGTRSPTGALQPGKHGAIYLAAKAGVPLIPVAITGTRDQEVQARLRRLRRLKIRLEAGELIEPPPMTRAQRDEFMEKWTTEIMCRLAALLPESYRGVYADHPRVEELLAQTPQN